MNQKRIEEILREFSHVGNQIGKFESYACRIAALFEPKSPNEVRCSRCGVICTHQFHLTKAPFDWGKDILCPKCFSEPKPDESKDRLLTENEMFEAYQDGYESVNDQMLKHYGGMTFIRKRQDLKTARIKDEAHQAEIAKLFEWVEEHMDEAQSRSGTVTVRFHITAWQSLKAQYLNQDTSPSSY